MKKAVMGLAIVLCLLMLVVILAPFFVDLNRYKDTLLAQIEPYVPRKVDFQNIELTVLSGLGAELRGLTVSENPAFPGKDFIQLERLQVRLQVLPLLKKQIKVKKLVLEKPVVHIARNEKGEFNFSDLVGGKTSSPDGTRDADGGDGTLRNASAASTADPPAEALAQESGAGMLAWLLVNELKIKQGTLTYEDSVLFPEAEAHVIRDLDLSVTDLSLQRPVSIELAANVLEATKQNVRISGSVGPIGEALAVEKAPFALRLSLGPLPLDSVGKDFLHQLPLQIVAGSANLAIEAQGSLDKQAEIKSEMELNEVVLQESLEEGGGRKTGALRCAVSEKAVLELSEQRVDFQSASVSINGNKVELKGKVSGFLGTPEWDLSLRSEDFRPASLVQVLPVLAEKLPPDLHVDGPLELHLGSSGNLQKMRVDARVDMNQMNVRYRDVIRKSAGVPLSLECKGEKEAAHYRLEDISLVLQQLVLNVSGEIRTEPKTQFGLLAQSRPVSLQGWESIVPLLAPYRLEGSFFLRSSMRGSPDDASINVQVSSDRIGFRLPPSDAQKRAGATGDAGSLDSVAVEVQAKQRKGRVEASGKINARKGQVKEVVFEGLMSNLAFSDDRLTVSGLDLKAFKGSLHASGGYEMKKGQWSFDPVVKGMDAGDALDTLTEYRGLFSGTLSANLHAQGTTQKGVQDALQAKGTLRLSKGELKNFDLLGEVLNALFQVKGVAQVLGGMGGDVERHASTRFEWLEGTFDMKGKSLVLDPVQLHNISTRHATDSDAVIDGKVALDTNLLDLKGKVILSKRHSSDLARQAEVLKALLNADQRMVLPMTLKGNIQKPVPFLDNEYVVGAVSRYYTRKGVDTLRKELGFPASKGGEEEPVQELLKGLFR